MGRLVGACCDDNVGYKKGAPNGAPFIFALLGGAGEVVAAHHTLDTTLGVHNSLFTCPKRVTLTADFSPQVFFC